MRHRCQTRRPELHWILPLWAALLVTFLPVLLPGPGQARAQAEPITLTMRYRTVDDRPVPGIAVTVRDAASAVVLAHATTDAEGLARFPAMPPTELRVRLAGSLASGTAVRHTRQDQDGIWVSLPARDWVMDLRIDVDGLVFPDLGLGNAGAPDGEAATAIAQGSLPIIQPTTTLATATPRPAMRQMPTAQPSASVARAGIVEAAAMPTSEGAAVSLLLLLLATIGGVVWLGARHRP